MSDVHKQRTFFGACVDRKGSVKTWKIVHRKSFLETLSSCKTLQGICGICGICDTTLGFTWYQYKNGTQWITCHCFGLCTNSIAPKSQKNKSMKKGPRTFILASSNWKRLGLLGRTNTAGNSLVFGSTCTTRYNYNTEETASSKATRERDL